MTKQQHSLFNRGPDVSWSKARDTPHDDVRVPVEEQFTNPETVPEPIQPESTPVKPTPKPPPISKSDMGNLVTAIITNFNTKSLMRQAYRTFHSFYPEIHVILVDNASSDGSTIWVQEMGARPNITAITFDHNVGHGPAMGKAIRQVETPYVLTLDTDTETIKGGWLQQMTARMRDDDKLYAIGWKRWVDKGTGVPKEWHVQQPPPENFVAYIHPSCGLYRVAMYHTLPPFFHHGAPCLNNMREAQRRELKVESFPVRDYVLHLTAGTRRMYAGRWDPKAGDRRSEWKKQGNWPI